jgi:cytidylate kinase
MNPMLITIDGPAGSGKSCTAEILSNKLGISRFNTGNIYRAIAYVLFITNKAKYFTEKEIQEIDVKCDGKSVFYHNKNITSFIRIAQVNELVIEVAKFDFVRKKVENLLREFSKSCKNGVVVEGRVMGSIVFPDAAHKFFLTAKPENRAKRRVLQFPDLKYDDVLIDIKKREMKTKIENMGLLSFQMVLL